MDFNVNKEGCRKVNEDMLKNLRDLMSIMGEYDAYEPTLRAALGDHYQAVDRTVRVIKEELNSAYQELMTITNDMGEYIERVNLIEGELS